VALKLLSSVVSFSSTRTREGTGSVPLARLLSRGLESEPRLAYKKFLLFMNSTLTEVVRIRAGLDSKSLPQCGSGRQRSRPTPMVPARTWRR
jgi:hypothetical protein